MDISNNSSVNLIEKKYLESFPGPKDSRLCKHFGIYPDTDEERNQTISIRNIIQYHSGRDDDDDYIYDAFKEKLKACPSYKMEYCQENGTTTLGLAASYSKYRIVEDILNLKNAPSLINAADTQGNTPLLLAWRASRGEESRKVFGLLLNKLEEFVEKKKCIDGVMLTALSILDKDSVFSELPIEIILNVILPKIIAINITEINSPFLIGPSKELDINTCAFNKVLTRKGIYNILSEMKRMPEEWKIENHILLERIEKLANTSI